MEAIKCLIVCGVNPNIGDSHRRNVFHLAVITKQFHIVRYFVEETYGRFDIPDNVQRTAIDYASALPDRRIVAYLLQQKESSRYRNNRSAKKSTFPKVIIQTTANEWTKKTDEEQSISVNVEDILLLTLFSRSAGQGDIKQMAGCLEQSPNFHALELVD